MNYLSEEQQQMLAERLVGESLTDDIKSISILQIGKGMIEGMLDPRMTLQGVVDGFGKTLTGVANLFNAEAWAKDPLGNLLQVGADISTGLAQIFSSILGIAGMITALMVAIIIISWGFATPVCAPVIGWMGTVMTYAGWGAIIAGSLSVLFNSLAYIKNLNDAGTAKTARELFGNTEQMKQNATDGLTGAMSIVEGVGAVKMGPVMKSGNFIKNIPKSPGAMFKNMVDGAKDGLGAVKNIPGNVVKGAKKLFSSGKKGLMELKDKIKKFFKGGPDVDAPHANTPHNNLPDKHTPHGGTPDTKKDLTPDGKKDITPDEIDKNKVAEHHSSDGHTRKVMDDGQVATCSQCSLTRKKYEAELKDPKNKKLKKELDDLEKKLDADPNNKDLIEQHKKLEAELEAKKKLNKQEVENAIDENGKLKPNVKYKSGEFGYLGETDELGRLNRTSTDNLQLTSREKRLHHDKNTPGKVKGDHAGHMFGDRFGGSPEIDNLVSQLGSVNLSDFKKIENQWADALKSVPPKKVTADIKIVYNGTDLRPSGFEVNWTIDGEPNSALLVN
jgi:hypothetical protein